MKLQLALLAAIPAFGQGIVGMSGSFGSGPDGALRGTATFHIGSFLPPPVINAPYSGEEVTETIQTLADGTRITRPNMGPQQKIWRDSQGRVRTERPIGPLRGNNAPPAIVQISDPVAGLVYVLDPVNHVAHRVRVDARPPGAAAMPRALPPPPSAAGAPPAGVTGYGVGFGGGPLGSVPAMPQQRWETTTEQLGEKIIDGVLCTGVRRTTIIPEGAQGNDRPMTTTNETWMSNALQLPLLMVSHSPLSGTSTRKYVNFSTADPPPSFFMVPPGYTIVDEKESFTIRWGEQ